MTRLTNLADIARSAGLKVIEVPGWKTRGHGEMGTVKTIVCHHTAGPAQGNMPSLNVVQNGRSDLAGPLAHFGLARDGTVYVIAAGLCWHAGDVRDASYGNFHAIGIEAEATGTAIWPDVQLDAYARLCRALVDAFDLEVTRVLGHKEVCAPAGRKSDPNFDMREFRARVLVSKEQPVTLIAAIDKIRKDHDVSYVTIARACIRQARENTKSKYPRVYSRLTAAAVALKGMS